MQDDERCLEPLRKIDCLQGLLYCAFAFFGIGGGKFVTVRGGSHYFDWKRTKIMQAGELNFASIEHFLDAWKKGKANAVAEFDCIKSERLDLAQHGFAIRVAT